MVSRDIRRILTQRAQYFNIYLDDVSITNLTFSREYTGAVEAKQVAQQEAERARFIVRAAVACTNACLAANLMSASAIVSMTKMIIPWQLSCINAVGLMGYRCCLECGAAMNDHIISLQCL